MSLGAPWMLVLLLVVLLAAWLLRVRGVCRARQRASCRA